MRRSWGKAERLAAVGLTHRVTYILRANVSDWSQEALGRTHVQLWQAKAAFRISKSDLWLRPIWHQRSDREQAQILVRILALCVWKRLEGWQSRAGLGNSLRTLLTELKRIHCVEVVLSTVAGSELRLRCVVEPDPNRASPLPRLGLRLPKPLRTPVRGGSM
jgi:hypothetical protein